MTTIETFEQAASRARLDGAVSDGQFMPENPSIEEARSAVAEYVSRYDFLTKIATAPSENQFCYLYMIGTPDERDELLAELIGAADKDPDAYEGLCHIGGTLMDYREDQPDVLRPWLRDHLYSKRTRPARRGRSPYANIIRDRKIVGAFRMLVDAGMTPSRHTRKKFPKSAADVVGEVMNLSQAGVLSIVEKSDVSCTTGDDDGIQPDKHS